MKLRTKHTWCRRTWRAAHLVSGSTSRTSAGVGSAKVGGEEGHDVERAEQADDGGGGREGRGAVAPDDHVGPLRRRDGHRRGGERRRPMRRRGVGGRRVLVLLARGGGDVAPFVGEARQGTGDLATGSRRRRCRSVRGRGAFVGTGDPVPFVAAAI
jgi:hypothetical protein